MEFMGTTLTNYKSDGMHISPEVFSKLPCESSATVVTSQGQHQMPSKQGWGQVQLTKYSSTPSTPNIYQVQVLVKYPFFLKVLSYQVQVQVLTLKFVLKS